MKRPLCIAGVMFALGEAISRSYWMTEYKKMAVAAVFLIPLAIYIVQKMVLRDRAIFFMLNFVFIFGVLWGSIYFSEYEVLPVGTEVSGRMLVTDMAESERGYSVYFTGNGEKYYSFISKGDFDDTELMAGRGYFFSGTAAEIKRATNPGEFDFAAYLMSRGVKNNIELHELRKDDEGDSPVRSFLWDRRCSLAKSVDRLTDPEGAGIIKAMLLGDKSDLSEDIRKMYQKNGIAHLLAISALHVALIAAFLKKLLRMFGIGRKKRAVITIGFLMLYGVMTGFSEATLRAFIILSVSCLAEAVGRTADKPTALSVAFLIMMILEPNVLMSSGFQMSYAAALGVVAADSVYRKIYGDERFLEKNRRKRKWYKLLVRGAIGSVTINAFMLPVLLLQYYEIPLYSLLINFLLIPLLTVVVASGFIGALIGLVPGAVLLGQAAIFPARVVLQFYKVACGIFLKLPSPILNPGHPRIWQLVVYVVLLVGVVAVVVRNAGDGRRRRRIVKSGLIHRAKRGRESGLIHRVKRDGESGLIHRVKRDGESGLIHRVKRGRESGLIHRVKRNGESGLIHRVKNGFNCSIECAWLGRMRSRLMAGIRRLLRIIDGKIIKKTARNTIRKTARKPAKNIIRNPDRKWLKKIIKVHNKKCLDDWEIRRKREKKLAGGYLMACILLEGMLVLAAFISNRRESFAAFLDVGQGSSVLVHSSSGINIIYDGGSSSNEKVGENIIVPALKYYGMSHIDIIFLSHGDKDHVNGLIYLMEKAELEGIKIDRICIGKGAVETEGLLKLLELARKKDCEIIYGYSGMKLKLEDTVVDVLYPFREDAYVAGAMREQLVEMNDGTVVKSVEPVGRCAGAEAQHGESVGRYAGAEAQHGESMGRYAGAEAQHGESMGRYAGADNASNENSLVIRLSEGDFSMLLTGDISSETEKKLIEGMGVRVDEGFDGGLDERGDDWSDGRVDDRSDERDEKQLDDRFDERDEKQLDDRLDEQDEKQLDDRFDEQLLDVDILQCPHHGSRYSSSMDFIKKTSPDSVIISCGRKNIYGHPAEETLERYSALGCEIYRTDQNGAVIVEY
ncbi:ComEC/Rec2-related protein [Eubacterium ruminantium]|nr:ComEC/Rec2-related protein [Eubacterium ruminantium]